MALQRMRLLVVFLSCFGGGIGLSAGEEMSAAVDSPPGMVSVSAGDRLVLIYNYKQAEFKPYIKELYTPGGLNVLLDAPDDHRHHHGLMFALGVDGIDFWGEHDPRAVGRQESVELKVRDQAGGSGFSDRIAWRSPEGETVLHETRTVHVWDGDAAPATLLTFATELALPAGQEGVVLQGSHYFGLGLRFVRERSVRETDGAARFLHAPEVEGRVFRGDERLTPGRWCAIQSTAGGKPVTVALFDHVLNPRHPAVFFTMAEPFAYLAATLHLHENPRTLRAGETLSLRYGVALFDSHAERSAIEEVYGRWLALEDPLAGRTNAALAERGTEAFASSEYGADYCAQKAIDGRFFTRETDKWNSKAHITPHYLRLAFSAPTAIDTVVIRHEGVLPTLDAFVYNTADYRLQGSTGAWGPWKDLIAPVRGNSDNVTVHRFDPVRLNYLRLLIETGEQRGGNAYGRIVELEAYQAPGGERDGRAAAPAEKNKQE